MALIVLVEDLRALEDKCQDEGRLDDMVTVGDWIGSIEESLRKGTDHIHEVVCECERCPHCNEVLDAY